MQRAQNACIRFIVNAGKSAHITKYYNQLRLLKLEDRRTLAVAVLMWKVFKTKEPKYLYEMFSTLSSVNLRNNRASPDMLIIPHHRVEKYSKSFCVTACRVYNQYQIYNYKKCVHPSQLRKNVTELLLLKYK